jgi:hypothetical protein
MELHSSTRVGNAIPSATQRNFDMTTCTPLKPFRCWQYRKDVKGDDIPKWMTRWANGVAEGWWAVENDHEFINWYTPAEFAERFKIVEEQIPKQ